jgi:hypothetical protein
VLTQTSPAKSEYRPEFYGCPEVDQLLRALRFAPVEGIAPLTRIEPQDYYTRQVVINVPGVSLQIPSNLELLLDKFYQSTSADQDRFLRACFWFNFASSAVIQSTSAAFTALISAIECLIPQERSDQQCPVCRRPTGKGSTRRLVEFLDQFSPATPTFQEARTKLYYEFRSRLSHGGELSFSDRTGHFLGLAADAMHERSLQAEVWGLVRIVLVNWLYSRSGLLIKIDRG